MKWAILNRQTLVFKMFLSFLVIVLLFSVINFLSVHMFNRGMQKEIIHNNQMMLQNTADRYQSHFDRIRTVLYDLYSNEKVTAFNRQIVRASKEDLEFWSATQVLKDIRSTAYNPMLYLDNLMIYFRSHSIVLEKEGSLDAQMQFSRFYRSDQYPLSFWDQQAYSFGSFTLHPEASFRKATLNESQQTRLIPFSFHKPDSNYQIIALMDAERMKNAFYDGDDSRPFLILDEEGNLLYRSTDKLNTADIPAIDPEKGYGMANGYYFFAKTEGTTHLTYINAVPYSSIASKIRATSLTLLLISALCLVLGLLASVLFTRKINRPVKQMVESILHRNPAHLQNSFQEFDLIHKTIHDLLEEKDAIHKELLGKRSLLTSFGYINKLKAISSDLQEWQGIAEIDEPFYVVLYELHFIAQPEDRTQFSANRMAYYIQEYVNVVMAEHLPASHTFQMENNQILTLVREEMKSETLDTTLSLLTAILNRDKEYLLVTIAVSSVYQESSHFHAAYREVLDLSGQARPADESQVIRERRALPSQPTFNVQQEQELYANLQAGNLPVCMTFVDRMLDQFDKKEASIQQFRQLASGVLDRVVKLLEPHQNGSDDSLYQQHSQRIQECYTLSQFKDCLVQLFQTACAIIQARKEEQDPTITFVMDYIENRFDDNLSLDLLAEKLNLSVAYLSVFIKEKTGSNFSDHLNEVRIRKAKEMLADLSLSVQEISTRIGYRNVTSFIRMFKKMTGIPPGEYRKNELFKAGGEETREQSN